MQSKKILLACSDAGSLRNFRGRLIESLLGQGHRVIALAPSFPPDVQRWCDDLGVVTDISRVDNQSLNPVKDALALAHLVRVVRRHRPDIVMGYTHKPALYTAFAAKLAGVPRVTMMVTGMGFGFEPGDGLARKLIPAITRGLFRVGCAVCDTIIFHNRDNRDFFVEEKLLRQPSKAVVVGGSGVDLAHFAPQPMPSAAPDALTFLLIARIVRYKGILEYARAAERLSREYPRARFLLAGYRDSNPLAYSDEEWRTIDANVTYLGPSQDVRPLYAEAHVYVLPSYGEGMPRTVLEAMASGRPIITTDTYGCRDTVEEGVNGHLVPVKQWEPLAQAMERFLSGRSPVPDMGQASRVRAERLFDVEAVNLQMVQALGL